MNSRRLFPTLKFTGQMCGPNRITPRRKSNLGFCYAHGPGVAEDWVEAYKWLLLAARQGVEAPKEHMTLLESKLLTPEQVAQGQKRAREFKPR
jgi:TPR repeat protein